MQASPSITFFIFPTRNSVPKPPAVKQPKTGAPLARPAPSKNPFAQNASFNQQTRKLLSKHYRAKFGVK
jgi:hypothetical protein